MEGTLEGTVEVTSDGVTLGTPTLVPDWVFSNTVTVGTSDGAA
jgi:hypothetical protein